MFSRASQKPHHLRDDNSQQNSHQNIHLELGTHALNNLKYYIYGQK